jgi:hypothetical protein
MTKAHGKNSSSLIKDFIEEFLDIRKGMLYTVRKLFLSPHKVYEEYTQNEHSEYTNPFKLLVTIVGLLTVLNVIVPTDEFEKRLAGEFAEGSTDNYNLGYKLGNTNQAPSEEKLTEVTEKNEQIFTAVFEFTDEYPLIAYFVTALALAIGTKLVFWGKVAFDDSFRLACYISIPINIISGIAIYAAVLLFSIDIVIAYFTIFSSLLTYGLLLIYLYRAARHTFDIKIVSSITRVLISFVFIQLIYAFIGIILAISFANTGREEAKTRIEAPQ